MTPPGQLDLPGLEEIADQSAIAINPGTRTRRGVSPQFERAKPAPPAPEVQPSPPPVAALAEIEPLPAAAPVLPRVVCTRDELLELIRDRRDELRLTHEQMDHIAGWASGLTSKLLAQPPIRGLGDRSFELILGALAIGVCRVEFVEDPEIAKRMSTRWIPRKRPKFENGGGALKSRRQR